MSEYQHTILELLSTLSESQTLLDEAASTEERLAPSPGLLEHSSEASKNHIEEFSDLIDLTELLDAWNRYLNERTRVHPETSLHEPIPGAPGRDDGPELDLPTALRQCAAAAETGYQKAIAHVTALGAMADQIEAQANRLTSAARSDDAEFKKKITEIVRALKDEHSRLRDDIDDKRKDLSAFNITLFGRTMTGKSTLMEILTCGDGSSIGKGAQRTTRDSRTYEWKGLTVTDVPGVAAYGGEDDAQTAHQAANQADLVLFLISDDGPQESEAEHLALLRQQGKSLLGIFNVKRTLDTADQSIRFFLRQNDRDGVFKTTNLQAISAQFDELIAKHLPGQKIELVSTHLHSRYLAGLPENAGKPWRDQLQRASRFHDVENRIIQEVITNGPFLRTNNFLNIAAAANLQAWESARQSAELCGQAQGRLTGRLDELRSWQTGFKRRANQRIDHLIQQTVGNLRNQVSSFANDNYENKNMSHHWNARVRNAGIDPKCHALQRQLAGECQEYFKQLVADMQQELRMLENQFQAVDMTTGKITDTRRRWNWGVTLAGSALGGIAGGLLLTGGALSWNPLGWALLGAGVIVGIAGLIGNLFKSRDKKCREAVAKIMPQLQLNLDSIERQIRDGMNKWLDDFSKQYLNRAEAQFNQLVQNQQRMANLMRSIAKQQGERLMAVNRDTIEQALQHLGKSDESYRILQVARIPGQAFILTSHRIGNLSPDTTARLRSLLREEVILSSSSMTALDIKNALKLDTHTSELLADQLALQ